MKMIVMSTDIQPEADSQNCWRDTICKRIHNVRVDNASSRNFAARISGRRYGDVSCASFWSMPHDVHCGREQLSNAGSAGYLLSWQIEGDALIEQDQARIRLAPGGIAIVDARRPMHVSFPTEVRRIVAKLPARAVEERLLSAAKKLTPAVRLSISDIAYKSGFNDISHFNHLFRRRFGMTPSDYREHTPLQ